jgi:hypothetical protein
MDEQLPVTCRRLDVELWIYSLMYRFSACSEKRIVLLKGMASPYVGQLRLVYSDKSRFFEKNLANAI